ncbi:MAG: hypothetical protein ACK4PI_10800 [Tepidisphaerales bacterium]
MRRRAGIAATVVAFAIVGVTVAHAAEGVIPLAGGKLELPEPGGFELLSRDRESATLTFRARTAQTADSAPGRDDGELLAVLTVEPSRGRPTVPAVRARVVEQLKAAMAEEARAAGMTVVEPPAEVADETVYVKVVDRVRVRGRERSRLRAVRLVGNWAVTLHAAADHPDADTRRALLERAKGALLGAVRLPGPRGGEARPGSRAGESAAERVVVVREAGLRLMVPPGYRAELTGAAEGVVAVFTHAEDARRRLVVTVVPLTSLPGDGAGGGRGGELSREVLLTAADRAVELETPRLGLPTPVGEWEVALDSRFLRRMRREAGDELAKVVSDTRQLRLDRAVVSVAMSCFEEDEDEVAGLADQLAETLRPARGR